MLSLCVNIRTKQLRLLLSFVLSLAFAASLVNPSASLAVGSYNNANIATKALTYVNQQGGNACNDAQKPGDSGGQCRAFVNCIVWMISNHSQNVGGGSNYFAGFLNAGGQEITDINQLSEGDIVQKYVNASTLHTFIIVSRVSVSGATGTFNVVDSNSDGNNDEIVRGGPGHNRTFSLSSTQRAFRMGTVNPPSGGGGGGGSPTPTCGKQADINCDGAVNIADLSLLLSSYGNVGRYCVTAPQFICDINGDGVVNLVDLSILQSRYLK